MLVKYLPYVAIALLLCVIAFMQMCKPDPVIPVSSETEVKRDVDSSYDVKEVPPLIVAGPMVIKRFYDTLWLHDTIQAVDSSTFVAVRSDTVGCDTLTTTAVYDPNATPVMTLHTLLSRCKDSTLTISERFTVKTTNTITKPQSDIEKAAPYIIGGLGVVLGYGLGRIP